MSFAFWKKQRKVDKDRTLKILGSEIILIAEKAGREFQETVQELVQDQLDSARLTRVVGCFVYLQLHVMDRLFLCETCS